MRDEMDSAQDTSAWLILLESSESQLYRGVSFFKAKVLWKMKISRMERTFDAFWRQVFNTKFDYRK